MTGMEDSSVGRVLWRAADDADFRFRARQNLGATLAEFGFVLTDSEMAVLREFWAGLHGLGERAALERIAAQARSYRR